MRKLCKLFTITITSLLISTAVFAHTEDDPFITDLIAGGDNPTTAIDVGDVKVWNDSDYLYVKYVITDPDWCITKTNLQVATSLDGIPQKKGNPTLGKFTYIDLHDCVTEFPVVIPLKWGYGTTLFIASYAQVRTVNRTGNRRFRYENAWGSGSNFPGKGWATYFVYTVQEPVIKGSIGDFIWHDLNLNGVQDADEPGIGGITIQLLDCYDNIVATTTSCSNGLYTFAGVIPGDYRIRVIDSPYLFTEPNMGTDDAKDSDVNPDTGQTACFTLLSGENKNTLDAGLFSANGSIGDFVWHDINFNGIQDVGEPGIAGVTVHLFPCYDFIIETTTTDTSGFYSFSNLMPNDYSIAFVAPPGYIFSQQYASGSTPANDSDAHPFSGKTPCRSLLTRENIDTVDAGLVLANGSIGNYVWNDLNRNGIQDEGEPGIAGIRVGLVSCGSSSGSTTTTDANGFYSFSGLIPGNYRVVFLISAPYLITAPNMGNDDATDSDIKPNGESDCIPLLSGQNNTTIDAGFYELLPAIKVEKYIYGQEADTPPGETVIVGYPVNFEFEVTNIGDVDLTNVGVTDDVIGMTFDIGFLPAGQGTGFTADGPPVELGLHLNIATVTGFYNGNTVSDSDPAYYTGVTP